MTFLHLANMKEFTAFPITYLTNVHKIPFEHTVEYIQAKNEISCILR